MPRFHTNPREKNYDICKFALHENAGGTHFRTIRFDTETNTGSHQRYHNVDYDINECSDCVVMPLCRRVASVNRFNSMREILLTSRQRPTSLPLLPRGPGGPGAPILP